MYDDINKIKECFINFKYYKEEQKSFERTSRACPARV